MKKILSFLAVVVFFLAPVIAEKPVKLEAGIATVAKKLSEKLPEGTKVVIFDIKSEKPEASTYIIEELTNELLEIGTLIVVDRQSIDAIRSELTFQTSGDVSDESAQRLGSMLGAQTLVSGSFELFNDDYRFALKAVKVETSEIQILSSLTIAANAETEALFGKKEKESKPSVVGKAARGLADFTGRLICSGINPAMGIGSFIQGDTTGGGTVVFWEIVGAGIGGYGYYMYRDNNPDWQFAAVAGGACFGVGVIYAIIRPWTYNRNPGLAQVLDNVRVTNTSANTMSVGYTVTY